MNIKFWILIGAFYLIRAFLNSKKKDKKNQAPTATPKKKKSKKLDDIFGDFMKEINAPKKVAKPISNRDTHKAEEDSNKKLDWQEVRKSKFENKKPLIDHKDYQNISHSDIEDEPIIAATVEQEEIVNTIGEIDLKKAIIYKEILDRKYFSV